MAREFEGLGEKRKQVSAQTQNSKSRLPIARQYRAFLQLVLGNREGNVRIARQWQGNLKRSERRESKLVHRRKRDGNKRQRQVMNRRKRET